MHLQLGDAWTMMRNAPKLGDRPAPSRIARVDGDLDGLHELKAGEVHLQLGDAWTMMRNAPKLGDVPQTTGDVTARSRCYKGSGPAYTVIR